MHGEEIGGYAYGMWPVVVFNIFLFLFFAISFIKPKKRFEWRSMGAFVGFIVALFTEMYGFPLTIYFLSTWMGKSYPVLDPFSHPSGHLVLVFLGLAHSHVAMVILHLISNGIIFFGFYLMYKGWMLIHGAKREKLVTEGAYSYVRHPQYVGLFLITVGFLIQWPSFTTLIMWPILIFAYYRLAMREERNVEKQFGQEFLEYKKRVPAFIPRFVRRENMEKMTFVLVLITLMVVPQSISFAQETEEMKGSMMGREMKGSMMGQKGTMQKGMMMCRGKMISMCPMHDMMLKTMMGKTVVATEDGGIVVMTGNKLMKYDKNLSLVKEIEVKMDIEGMQKMMEQMMEKCPMRKMAMEEGMMGEDFEETTDAVGSDMPSGHETHH